MNGQYPFLMLIPNKNACVLRMLLAETPKK